MNWTNLLTVGSASVLVGTEVVAAAFAAGWAFAGLLGLGPTGTIVFEAVGSLLGLLALYAFWRTAVKVEPIRS